MVIFLFGGPVSGHENRWTRTDATGEAREKNPGTQEFAGRYLFLQYPDWAEANGDVWRHRSCSTTFDDP